MNRFIDVQRATFGVEPICRTLAIAPSTYYTARSRPPSARAVRDAELKADITDVHQRNLAVYGVRKVWRQLCREGVQVKPRPGAAPQGRSRPGGCPPHETHPGRVPGGGHDETRRPRPAHLHGARPRPAADGRPDLRVDALRLLRCRLHQMPSAVASSAGVYLRPCAPT